MSTIMHLETDASHLKKTNYDNGKIIWIDSTETEKLREKVVTSLAK